MQTTKHQRAQALAMWGLRLFHEDYAGYMLVGNAVAAIVTELVPDHGMSPFATNIDVFWRVVHMPSDLGPDEGVSQPRKTAMRKPSAAIHVRRPSLRMTL
jgi:hypothetical protein